MDMFYGGTYDTNIIMLSDGSRIETNNTYSLHEVSELMNDSRNIVFDLGGYNVEVRTKEIIAMTSPKENANQNDTEALERPIEPDHNN